MVWQFVSGHVEGVLEFIVVHIVVTICVNLRRNIRKKWRYMFEIYVLPPPNSVRSALQTLKATSCVKERNLFNRKNRGPTSVIF